jgi:hypothetical protein
LRRKLAGVLPLLIFSANSILPITTLAVREALHTQHRAATARLTESEKALTESSELGQIEIRSTTLRVIFLSRWS